MQNTRFFSNINSNSSSSSNPFVCEQKDRTGPAQENIAEPPHRSTVMTDMVAITSSSSSKRRRSIQKKVVFIPMKETKGSQLKGESNTPPSDSWAWRKYGQKPIKGSPYPRGYYRCSSSKGCPARKQVERSSMDPTMLVVTYSCEHNHSWPPSRNNNNNSNRRQHQQQHQQHYGDDDDDDDTMKMISEAKSLSDSRDPEPAEAEAEPESEEKVVGDVGEESPVNMEDQFGWFGDMESTTSISSRVLESPTLTLEEMDMGYIFMPMREEDESLFADLGELPECSMVFQRGLGNKRQSCTAAW